MFEYTDIFFFVKHDQNIPSFRLSQIALGTKKDSRAYSVGDVVGCGVEGDFDDDGFLVPEQEITVYFTRNGDRVGQFKQKKSYLKFEFSKKQKWNIEWRQFKRWPKGGRLRVKMMEEHFSGL